MEMIDVEEYRERTANGFKEFIDHGLYQGLERDLMRLLQLAYLAGWSDGGGPMPRPHKFGEPRSKDS